jgi:hypothetical protein
VKSDSWIQNLPEVLNDKRKLVIAKNPEKKAFKKGCQRKRCHTTAAECDGRAARVQREARLRRARSRPSLLSERALTSMRIVLKTQAWSQLYCSVLPHIWEMSIQLLLRFCSLCFIKLRSRAKAFALLLFVAILLIAGIASIRKQARVPVSKPWVGSPICEIPRIAPCSFFSPKTNSYFICRS